MLVYFLTEIVLHPLTHHTRTHTLNPPTIHTSISVLLLSRRFLSLQAMYTVHIFPSCDFANENLNRIAPDLMHRVAEIAHLLIVIATV